MSEGPPGEEPSEDGMRPTSGVALVGWAGAGLVGGWLLHPLAERMQGTAPIVTWTQALALFLMAAVLGAVAVRTWREVHVRHEWLEPHRAVNRLVLARACAVVGALVAGGYLGYAISWLGVDAELAGQRAWRSLTAGAGGVADGRGGAGPRACVSRPFRWRHVLTCSHVFPTPRAPRARRRQRSTRLTVAVALIALSAVVVSVPS